MNRLPFDGNRCWVSLPALQVRYRLSGFPGVEPLVVPVAPALEAPD